MNAYFHSSAAQWRPATPTNGTSSGQTKWVWELVLLGVLLGMGAELMFRHPFFVINDVQITGLDAYGYQLTKEIVEKYRQEKIFTHERNNFYLLRTNEIADRVKQKLAIDQITLEKKFPHTLKISALERPLRAAVELDNGIAAVTDGGELVRWFATTSSLSLDLPHILQGGAASSTAVESKIISAERLQMARDIYAMPIAIKQIIMLNSDPERIEVQLTTGKRVLLKALPDMSVQIKKALLTLEKYPRASSIDVRFADKVFVAF